MGLDMYLEGEKFLWTNWEKPELNLKEDGFEVKGKTLRLGYWRKHPNLHGFIVKEFAAGVDECQRIDLSIENCQQIIDATKKNALPETKGFFFGVSQPEDDADTIEQLEKAIKWAQVKEEGVSRSIVYRASW